MGTVTSIFNMPLMLGSSVTIPIVLFMISLVVGVKPVPALKSSLSVSFSVVGITLLISRFGTLLMELAELITENFGQEMQIADVGRKAAVAITSASRIGLYIIPMALVINLLLLLVKATRTINIDLWSFWLFTFTGAMTESLTGNFIYGMIAAGVAVVFTLVMADRSAIGMERCCGLPGISSTNGVTASFGPIAGGVCALLDLIPIKTKRKDITFGWLQKRVGYLGDPVLLGTIAVCLMGFICQYDTIATLQLGIQMGAIIFITPKMMLLLGDAMLPLASGLEKISKERLNLRGNLTIGLNSITALGNPTALFFSIIMVPVTLWLATVLPGNQFMPTADLAMLPYLLIMVVVLCRGGLLRTAISSVLSIIVMLYCATALSGLFSQAAVAADTATYGAVGGAFSSMYCGGSPLTWLTTKLGSFGIAGMGMLIVLVLVLIIWNYNCLTGNVKIYVKKQMALRASAIDDIKEEAERHKELSQNAVSKKRASLRHAVELDKLTRQEGVAGDVPLHQIPMELYSPGDELGDTPKAPTRQSSEEKVKTYQPPRRN